MTTLLPFKTFSTFLTFLTFTTPEYDRSGKSGQYCQQRSTQEYKPIYYPQHHRVVYVCVVLDYRVVSDMYGVCVALSEDEPGHLRYSGNDADQLAQPTDKPRRDEGVPHAQLCRERDSLLQVASSDTGCRRGAEPHGDIQEAASVPGRRPLRQVAG